MQVDEANAYEREARLLPVWRKRNTARKTLLEKTFSLLKNPRIPLDAIPFQCGYAAAPAYLKTYCKRVTGLTMRDWRKKNTQ